MSKVLNNYLLVNVDWYFSLLVVVSIIYHILV